MAPLGITFYDGEAFDFADGSNSSFAFVTFHGSWNRSPAAGYRVDLFDFRKFNSEQGGVYSFPFLERDGSEASGTDWIRPVQSAVAKCPFGDCLYVTDDYHGNLIAIGKYDG